ncbi:hypothetical protein Drose_33400 [Dactylosporangium roseum]|uniref:Uncharacterized protein n=1 Tax=Dactylosporangium roseum TaxID=47989 RepID=A0ABY5Z1M2_9ACTN|nr:hypothetical protein [Dactylosporangium roseum]UWZ35930.1 hypothetical protein Drose_33400 [Dactylosporangium roseum]
MHNDDLGTGRRLRARPILLGAAGLMAVLTTTGAAAQQGANAAKTADAARAETPSAAAGAEPGTSTDPGSGASPTGSASSTGSMSPGSPGQSGTAPIGAGQSGGPGPTAGAGTAPGGATSPGATTAGRASASASPSATAGTPGTPGAEPAISIRNTGSLQTDRATLRVVSGRTDLTGQRELGWVAGQGEPFGSARCTQELRLVPGGPVVTKPELLICWRTSPVKSVYTVAVSLDGHPSREISVAAIDEAWDELR